MYLHENKVPQLKPEFSEFRIFWHPEFFLYDIIALSQRYVTDKRNGAVELFCYSWYCSSNLKSDQSGPWSIQLISRAVLIWQAYYGSQACRANTHPDLGCVGQEPLRSVDLLGIDLLGYCVCRSFNNLQWQNWLAGPGPAVLRKFCVAWVGG